MKYIFRITLICCAFFMADILKAVDKKSESAVALSAV
jgi:hypothetical protein